MSLAAETLRVPALAGVPAWRCAHHAFEASAATAPGAPAVSLGGCEVSYAALDRRARAVAARLRALGVGPERRVVVLMEPGPDFAAALLGVLKAGGAYVPIDPEYPPERIAYVLEDSAAAAVLTHAPAAHRLSVTGVPVVDAGAVDPALAERFAAPLVDPDNLAYVIYTSGSTGRPKGVGVTHRSLTSLQRAAVDLYGLTGGDRVGNLASVGFDVSVDAIFSAWAAGAAVVFRPRRVPALGAAFLRWLEEERITFLNPPTALWHAWVADLAASGSAPPPTLRLVIAGGEQPQAAALARWRQAAPGVRWMNGYGPTEATVFATTWELPAGWEGEAPIGRARANARAYVLDADGRPATEGELHVGGPAVARGYLGRPAATAERFVPDPFAGAAGARMYRTGDRVRLRPDGELEFLGRFDDQVKVGGFRVEPGEVAAVLAEHPGVAQAAVVARRGDDGAARLAGYAILRPGAAEDDAALRRWLRGRLPAYMVPPSIDLLPALPLNAHGKVDRGALPPPAAAAPGEAAGGAGGTVRALAEIWREVLGVSVSPGDDFFDLGGHSLPAMQVLSRVRRRFGVELPVRALFDAPTPAALAALVDAEGAAPPAAEPPLAPAGREGPLPLSFAQQRLWFLHQMEPGSPFYNIPNAVRLAGALDRAALGRALAEIVRRHQALRTTFHATAGGAVQAVHPAPDGFPLPCADLGALPRERAEEEARRLAESEAARPFDLARDPLLRARLVRVREDEHLLVLVLHHVAGDGWSLGVLFRELAALYEALRAGRPSPLPDPPVQYADYAVWQREWLSGEVLEAQLAYWRARLAGAPAVLELPTDRPRPSAQSYRGAVERFEVPPSLAARLREAARRHYVTPFMVLLTGFDLLVHRLSGRDDVVVGSPIAGRVRREVEELIGFFVNTVALRMDLSGDPTVGELLRRVRETTLEAYAHQDLPFERVVEELQPERTLSRNPLFQVAFALQNVAMDPVDLPGLELALEDVDSGTSKFDLFLEMREEGGRLRGCLEYAADLWKPATARRMTALYLRLLEAVAADADLPISRVALLDAAAARAAAAAWNRTARPYPRESTVPAVFAERAEAAPGAVALSWDGGAMTYGELHARSSRLAHRLVRLGVRPDEPVAVLAERSPELVVALLAILKAGGCYVPINPKYPPGRVALMLEDSGARVLVAHTSPSAKLPGAAPRIVLTNDPELDGEPAAAPAVEVCADHAAYVVYTSGSTGRPKGVVVPHRAVLRLVLNSDFADFGADQVWLQLAPAAFDASTLEIWAPLLNGGRLALYPPIPPDPAELGAFLRRHGVTSAWLTAAFFQQVADRHLDSLGGLRQLLAGGDVLPVPQVRRVLDALPGLRLVNGYGPTENTTFSCCRTVAPADAERASIPIGTAIANSTAYVLDAHLRPVPADVPGELYVGGDGVARGYLGAPALTAERYLPDPFAAVAGARLYRTGDRVRRRPDGAIEFLGRLDEQVKLRGYRVEPGEIEAVLERHPSVASAVVQPREDAPGEKRLVAYVVPARPDALAREPAGGAEATAGRQVHQWESLFDDVYGDSRGTGDGDVTFDLTGWNSSYTGQPIPAEEMREWVERTVELILALRLRRVLELGVGTGLLLFRVAPRAAEYVGTDLSGQVLRKLEARLRTAGAALPPVTLLQREAADFGGLEGRRFDTVVLNSVSQYFPSADYFARVLERAAQAVDDGGAVFVGDVRSRCTLEAFRTAVELDSAAEGAPTRELARWARRAVDEEEELVVEPDFFRALRARLPRVRRVEARVKRGVHHNELTRHRFDVVLHLGPPGETVAADAIDWAAAASLGRLREMLVDRQGEPLAVLGIPDARLWREVRMVELLAAEDAPATAGELRAALVAEPSPAVDPEALWALGDELGVAVEVRPAGPSAPGRVDALFRPAARTDVVFPEPPLPAGEPRAFANDPLWAAQARDLAPRLKAYAREQLPEHMVPAALVVLDALPLTPNGKVDRSALPDPEPPRPAGAAGAAPRTATEAKLAAIWAEVLRLERVYADDNFFDLGGHSLLATQLATRVREAFGVPLPLQRVFEAPTVAALAALVDAAAAAQVAEVAAELELLSDDEVRTLLEAEGAWDEVSATGDRGAP